MRKNITEVPEVPDSTTVGIIQSTTEVGKEVENIIKELLYYNALITSLIVDYIIFIVVTLFHMKKTMHILLIH